MRIVSSAPGSCLYPVAISTFQSVSEAQVCGIDKAQRGVLDLEIVLARQDLDRGLQIVICGIPRLVRNCFVVDPHLFKHHWRRPGVDSYTCRINDRYAAHRRKPQLAIARFDSGGPDSPVAFGAWHPIALVVSHTRYGLNATVRKII